MAMINEDRDKQDKMPKYDNDPDLT